MLLPTVTKNTAMDTAVDMAVVVTAAVEKAADIEKLRANFAARYGL